MTLSPRRAPRLLVVVTITLAGLAANIGVGSPPAVATVNVARFTSLPPERILDTRSGKGVRAGVVRGGTSIDLQVTGAGGVPVGVTAVAFNLTATEAGAAGYVTAWPSGSPRPTVSNINLPRPGATVANLVVVAVPPSGLVSLFSLSDVHLLADVAGYWTTAPGGVSQGGRFVGLAPRRLLDTREGLGAPKALPAAHSTVTFTVAGREGVPATGAAAVALVVTATQAAAAGFVTAWPAGSPQPDASVLNLAAVNDTVPNLVIVPLGAGQVSLYTLNATHLLADVVGWFTDDTQPSASAGLFVAVPPTRVLDSRQRSPFGQLWPGQRNDLVVTGQGGVPASGVSAVVANLTATDTSAAGFVTAYPAVTAAPNASNLNSPAAGSTTSSLAFVAVGSTGAVSLYSSGGTEVLADVAGYFVGSPQAAQPGVPAAPPSPPAPPIVSRPAVAGAGSFACLASAPMDQIKRVDVNPGLLTYLQDLTPYATGAALQNLAYTFMVNSGPLPARVALDPVFASYLNGAVLDGATPRTDLMQLLNLAYHETIHHLQNGSCVLSGPSTGYPTPRVGFPQSSVFADVNARIDAIKPLSGQDAAYAHTVASVYLKPGDPISAQGFESQMWEINAYVLSAEWGAAVNDAFGVNFLGDIAGNDDTMSAKFHQLARYLNLAESQPAVWAQLQTGGSPRTVAEHWNLGVKSWQLYKNPRRDAVLFWDLAFGPDVGPIAAFTANAAGTTAPPRPTVPAVPAPSLVTASAANAVRARPSAVLAHRSAGTMTGSP